jgi:hypothetical protein
MAASRSVASWRATTLKWAVTAGDSDDPTCGAQLIRGHVRETDMPDQALPTQLRESADLVFERGILRPAAVQVVQVDPLDTEAPSAHVRTLSQVVGVADRFERRVLQATADEASLGRDDEVLGVGVQCFADQQFIGVGSVGVSGVDQGHTGLNGLSQKRDSAVTVGVFAPLVRAGEPHCAVADTTDL